MTTMSRRRAVGALAATAALTLSACAGSDGREGGTRATSDILRIAGPFEVHSLEPAADGEIFTRLQVTETLVTSDVRGALAPGLAQRWSASEDNTRWQLDLVEGATFHDGTPVTPQAVVASLTKAATVKASPLADLPIARIVPGADAVTIELTQPTLTLPAVLTHYSAGILAPSAYDTDGKVTKVVGTGPFRIEGIELPSSIRTTRFTGWRGAAPVVEKVTFQAVGRPESRALMAASDQADIVFGLEPAGRARVEAAEGVQMESTLQPRTILLKVNAGDPALKDVRVRRALSMALDRASMAQAVLRDKELAATQLLPPSLTQWKGDVEPLTQDVDGARALLAEAGWTPGPDGTLVRGGTPLRITLLTYPDRPELPALATAIQAALAEVGASVRVEVSNSSEIPAGQADGSLQMALIAKHFALVSDPLVDIASVFAPGGADWGVMNWNDPSVDRAVSALLRGGPEAEAARHRATIVRAAHDQLPLIPVAWYRMNAAVNERVDGFVIDPLETTWRITDLRWTA